MSPKLHRVQVPLMSGKECEKRFREAGYKLEIDKTIICAGWPEGGKDACQVKKNGNTSAYCSFYCVIYSVHLHLLSNHFLY